MQSKYLGDWGKVSKLRRPWVTQQEPAHPENLKSRKVGRKKGRKMGRREEKREGKENILVLPCICICSPCPVVFLCPASPRHAFIVFLLFKCYIWSIHECVHTHTCVFTWNSKHTLASYIFFLLNPLPLSRLLSRPALLPPAVSSLYLTRLPQKRMD